uniref:C2H2-type domain-containing protein n=1 Tax=Natrinema zhouii TaxID=1710539 RepID=A0A7D6CR57_9EURY
MRDEPPVRCPYCDRPFRRARYESLHRGLEHPDRLSERERATVERAVREERAETRRFRLYALGVLVLLYFGLLIVAAFVV